MELQVIQFLMVMSSCAYFACGHTVQTPGVINAQMGHHVQLSCTYTPSADDWMFIKWTRTSNGVSVNLASLLKGIDSVDWASSAPTDFRDHVELNNDRSDGLIKVNLIIDGFLCTDVGVYTCEVFTMSSIQSIKSNTTLEIEAHPGSPNIRESTIEVNENDTFRIHCHADAGIPAHTITWAYRLADTEHIYTKVFEGIKQVNSDSRHCMIEATSTATVTMTQALDGATFLCSIESELGQNGEPSNFDEVFIQLYRKPTTTKATTSTTRGYQLISTESSASSMVPSAAVLIISSCCLVTIFNFIASRTS